MEKHRRHGDNAQQGCNNKGKRDAGQGRGCSGRTLRVMEVWSPSGNCMTMPKARPRGMMVALWMGSEPSVFNATNACPAS
jgi:hypothetical protein